MKNAPATNQNTISIIMVQNILRAWPCESSLESSGTESLMDYLRMWMARSDHLFQELDNFETSGELDSIVQDMR
jgi:hypothetical protein